MSAWKRPALVILGIVCVLCAWAPRWLSSDIPQFPTPEWESLYPDHIPGRYSVSYRRDPNGDEVLFALIKNTGYLSYQITDTIYRYDIENRALSRHRLDDVGSSDPADWHALHRWLYLSYELCGPLRDGVWIKGRCLIPEGRLLACMATPSLSGRFAFVIAADGPREPPRRGSFLMGEGGSPGRFLYGQHYLQLASVSNPRFVGLAIKISIETARERYGAEALYWVGGEDLIAIIPPSGAWLSVVHTADLLGVPPSEFAVNDE